MAAHLFQWPIGNHFISKRFTCPHPEKRNKKIVNACTMYTFVCVFAVLGSKNIDSTSIASEREEGAARQRLMADVFFFLFTCRSINVRFYQWKSSNKLLSFRIRLMSVQIHNTLIYSGRIREGWTSSTIRNINGVTSPSWVWSICCQRHHIGNMTSRDRSTSDSSSYHNTSDASYTSTHTLMDIVTAAPISTCCLFYFVARYFHPHHHRTDDP